MNLGGNQSSCPLGLLSSVGVALDDFQGVLRLCTSLALGGEALKNGQNVDTQKEKK